MLGLDQNAQERWRKEEAKQKATEVRQRALAQELQSNTVSVEDDAGFDVASATAQMGKPMTAQQVIEKLKKCNSRLVFHRHNGLYGVYVLDPQGKLLATENGDVVLVKHICGMETGVMPEFSILHKTKKNVPNEELFGNPKATREIEWKQVDTFACETRGWRTVLVRLLHSGLITRYQVEKHFGWKPSRDSKKWHDRTQ